MTFSNKEIFAYRISSRGLKYRFLINKSQLISSRKSSKRSRSFMNWKNSKLKKIKLNWLKKISELMRKSLNFNNRLNCSSSVMRGLCQDRAQL